MINDLVPTEDILSHLHPENIFDSIDIRTSTRKEYKYFIKYFFHFIQNKKLSSNTFLEYKKYLAARTDISTATKNKYLTSSKVFLKELNRKRILPFDITQNIKSFTQSKKHKKEGLNNEEVRLLAKNIQNLPDTSKNARLKAILCLLIFQGLRQCEIIRLNIKDVDLLNGSIFIQGKGQDDKESVYLHPETLRALKVHLKVNRIADGAIFTSFSNNNKYGRMTTNALRQTIKEILNALGIEKSVHGFRHYFTTKLIKAYKGDLLEVARYTRHKNLEMLQVYNDNIKVKADLPRFYETFADITF